MHILVTGPDPESGPSNHRLHPPLQALAAATRGSLRALPLERVRRRDLHEADLLLLRHGGSRQALALVRHMRASGGRVLVDVDDLPLAAGLASLQASALQMQVLREADTVTAPTERLAGLLRPLARRVCLAPDFAPPEAPPAAPRCPGAPLTLVLAAPDLRQMKQLPAAVARVQDRRPGELRVLALGAAAEALRAGGVLLQALPMPPRPGFLELLASQLNPLLVLPAEGACCSARHFLEAAAVGVPVLAPRQPPYAEAMVDGVTGTLVDDREAAWEQALLRALERPTLLQAQARVARAEMQRRHSLQASVAAWQRALQPLAAAPRTPVPAHLRWPLWLGEHLERLGRLRRLRASVQALPAA